MPRKMQPSEDSNKEDGRRAMAMAVANLVLALHFDLLTFLCDNMFKKGFASNGDFDHETFMKLYRCVAHTAAIVWTLRALGNPWSMAGMPRFGREVDALSIAVPLFVLYVYM